MKYLYSFMACYLLLLPGCHYKNRTESTLEQINKWSREAIQTPLHRTMLDTTATRDALKDLSRDKAFEITLRNNTAFLAQLEEIGIKSSDLIQAGFFSNPNIETILLFPTPAEQTDINLNVRFSLSDFWQVPLRKKIAEDELTIKTFEIMESIISLRKQTYTTFHKCIFEKMRYHVLEKTVQALQSLKEHIDYRFQFGFVTALDIQLASVELYRQQSKLMMQNGILNATLYDLQYLLGINEPSLCINIKHMLAIPRLTHSSDELFTIAQQYHPTLLLQDMQIKKADHTIRYEQSRIVDNVDIGISYNRDFDKNTAGVGPIFSLDVPLFNTNYGNIERARYEREKARYNYQNSLGLIQSKINSLVARYTTILQTIEFYPKQIFPALRKAIEYTQQQMHVMQLPTTILIDAELKYLQAGEEFIDYLEEASNIYAKLEKAVGKSLLS